MDNQLDRIERKLDKLDSKLDSHSERISRVESSQGWIKWTLTLIVSAVGTIGLAISRYVKI